MKVGDKVVYIGGKFKESITAYYLSKGYSLPSPKKVYTIRDIYERRQLSGVVVFIRLQEIINPPCDKSDGEESGYNIKAFRKIETTPELSETTYEQLMTEIETKELQTA